MGWEGGLLIVALLCSGCAVGEAYSGYPMTEKGRVEYEQQQHQAEIAKQQAEILKLYKECLVRNQQDKSVDCSEFRTALQVIDTRK